MIEKTANSLRTHSNLLKADESTSKALNRIASGKRINSASDDPAGLAVAMAMESQNRGLLMQIANRQDEISLMQTAEGALGSTNDMLQRMNELSVQAANGTLTDADREAIQLEVDQIRQQIDQTANNTNYNTKPLLDGSLDIQLQNGQQFSIPAMNSSALGVDQADLSTQSGASQAIGQVTQAINQVTSQRSTIGAIQNRIASEISSLRTELINTTAAQSRIEDADMAMEIINMYRSELQSKAAIKAFKMQDENRTAVLGLLSD
ncbi:MAG: flagellin [Candidatus Rifleibacteriota bacterium]